jgi:hypothetical protein
MWYNMDINYGIKKRLCEFRRKYMPKEVRMAIYTVFVIILLVVFILKWVYDAKKHEGNVLIELEIEKDRNIDLMAIMCIVVIGFDLHRIIKYYNYSKVLIYSEYIKSIYNIFDSNYVNELIEFFNHNHMDDYLDKVYKLRWAVEHVYRALIWSAILAIQLYRNIKREKIIIYEDGLCGYSWNEIKTVAWGEIKNSQYREIHFRTDRGPFTIGVSIHKEEKLKAILKKVYTGRVICD